MNSKRKVLKYLKSNNIDFLRVCYSDIYGILRSKDILISEIKDIYNYKYYFCNGIWTLTQNEGILENNFESNNMGVPDFSATPDWSTLRTVPWEKNTAIVICNVENKESELSPRNVLINILQKYKKLGIEVEVGPEIEFYLLNKDFSFSSDKKWMMYTNNSSSKNDLLLKDALKTMSDFKTGCYSVVHEYSPSQYEININHTSALDAADNLFLFKYGLKNFFYPHNLIATFYPNPVENNSYNGLHLHISLKKKNKNYLFQDKKITDQGKNFIAGILKHAKALSAFANPNIDSYERLNNVYGVPYTDDWGYDNRTTYIRIPKDLNRIEVRSADGSSNIYLLLASILAAGLDGINNQYSLKKEQHGYDYPRKKSTLPSSLTESLLHLNLDDVIVKEIGKKIINSFTVLKRKEIKFESYESKKDYIEYF